MDFCRAIWKWAGLPAELAQGLFAKPRRYPVVLRISTVPGDILADSVSTPRGMSVKVIGVEGERLEGSENDVTQDFLLVNGPAFGSESKKISVGAIGKNYRSCRRAQEGALGDYAPGRSERSSVPILNICRSRMWLRSGPRG